MKVIVIGYKGMLGTDLVASLEVAGHSVIGLDIPEIDITEPKALLQCLHSLKSGLVINCAAYTAVDKAESEPEICFRVNRDGAANLAEACKALGCPLIHISTDYIFDGNATQPYHEDDPANPAGVYAMSKWEGEVAVRSRLSEHLIIRTAWLFGVHGQNFVKTMLRLARDREELKVVADQYGCPTWTGDLAKALVTIAKKISTQRDLIQWGTYHFCGSGITTWHGFAEAIIEEGMRREPLKTTRILPITTAEYPTPARRPAWSALDCRKIQTVFGITPQTWQSGLAEVIKGIYEP